ncbi:hypothetical protein [Agriterribacter humi]|jgi:hypothetical protein|uniref:hypothetical protein n=1 Tax=Agriterribacter humi TaxID=1104781 RepID=UPI0012649A75|nr:hypothetical protein [Agriterribacter humi]
MQGYIIFGILVIAVLSFWLPYRQGKKQLAFTVGILLTTFMSLIFIPIEGIFFLFLGFPILFFAVIFISYWTLINLGFKKAGKVIAVTLTILASIPILAFVLEDYLFFKSDAKSLLKDNEIVLVDKFSIKANEVSGMRDMYHKFELQITENDKNRLVNQLRQSGYFTTDTTIQEYNLQNELERGLSKRVFKDYERIDFIRRESYEKLKQGYKPDFDIITISKNDNKLTFERVND